MRKELDEKLCEKYPDIFVNRNGDMRTTAMFWGFECGDGWFDLIDMACATIRGHINSRNQQIEWAIKRNDEYLVAETTGDWSRWIGAKEKRVVPEPIRPVVATQVKEKFGGLRFYYDGGDEFIDGVVTMAENLSYRCCEECGAPGKSTETGWIRTLCEAHTK